VCSFDSLILPKLLLFYKIEKNLVNTTVNLIFSHIRSPLLLLYIISIISTELITTFRKLKSLIGTTGNLTYSQRTQVTMNVSEMIQVVSVH